MDRRMDVKSSQVYKIAIIGDEDTVAGFLMAGVGERDAHGRTNFLIVKSQTLKSSIEEAFKRFTQERQDIAVILINQHIAEEVRYLLELHTATIPTILEIPSKNKPYDISKDCIVQRVRVFFGGELPS